MAPEGPRRRRTPPNRVIRPLPGARICQRGIPVLSENTQPEAPGSDDAPAERRARKRVAKPAEAASPASESTPATPPVQAALPMPSAPSGGEPAPAASAPAPQGGGQAKPKDTQDAPAQQGGGQQGGQQNPNSQNGGQNGGQNGNDGDREGGRNRRARSRNRRDRQRERFRDDGGMQDDGAQNQPHVPRPHPSVPEGFPQYSLGDLKRMPAHKLLEIAEQLNIHEGVARARKQDVIFALLKVLTRHGEGVQADGVLEILPDGFGFLRAAEASYLAGPDDTYISPSQIRRFNLRTGDHLSGRIRWPKDGERYFALSVVDTINGEPLEASKNKTLFENLTPLFPRRRFRLERGDGSTEDITGRILDLMAPQGKGQRSLIVSQPKAGKTMMMQQIATAITTNHPDVHLIVLLIDERPEEVTEMQRTVRGEVISSTFDEPAARHVQVAEMVIERAKRLVEHKKDV